MHTTYIMRRTQIYITDEQAHLLESRSRTGGKTISELIRTAIDDTYRPRRTLSRADRARLARETAGAWRDFPETGRHYVERLRGSRHLAHLHGRDGRG